MNTSYKENTPDNFWQIRWLDRYMEGHNGFIAGGCFKNILSGERVKDIDIFFESNDDFQDAVDLFNSDGYVKDFTVAKMAYFKQPKYDNSDDDIPFSSEKIVGYEYRLLHHENFFEHLHMKRLVIDENIPFPISTWERTYRYKGYGYNMCRETKKKLLEAIQKTNLDSADLSMYNNGGWD
jgi:hypothetical protein